ncbi:hypothetical protein KP509_12G079300 [Ceratopteris richardii]|nr:hypothetical protein KP509_12G079300 [Ceratopteris richardii]
MKQKGGAVNTSTYGILLCMLGHMKMTAEAMELWAEMVLQGNKPDRKSYNGMLDALTGDSDWEMGINFFKRMVEEGINPDFLSCQAISKLFFRAGQTGKVLLLAQSIQDISVKRTVYESFVRTLGSAGCVQEVFALIEAMKADDVVPTVVTYLGMIDVLCSTAAEPSEVTKTVEEMEKDCGKLSLDSFNSILTSLCHSHRFQVAYDMLKECHRRQLSPEIEISNAIFVGLSIQGKWQLTDGVFEELKMMGSRIKLATFNVLLQSSAQVGDVETTKKILRIMEENTVYPNVDTYNAAIGCFARAGRLRVALQVFNEMGMNGCIPNTSSYNSVLFVLCKAGLTDAALSFFERMQADGIKPDSSTFSILCSIDKNREKLNKQSLEVHAEKRSVAVA